MQNLTGYLKKMLKSSISKRLYYVNGKLLDKDPPTILIPAISADDPILDEITAKPVDSVKGFDVKQRNVLGGNIANSQKRERLSTKKSEIFGKSGHKQRKKA